MAIDQNIFVTADAVIFRNKASQAEVLLIQRKNEPFKGQWALPGGFVEEDEDLPNACARELQEETGITISAETLKQVGAYGKPDRDPRSRTVTVAYFAIIEDGDGAKGADDAKVAQWWNINKLPDLAFDHSEIIEKAKFLSEE